MFNSADHEVVEFKNNIHSRIFVEPMYYNLKFNSQPNIYGRRIVLEKIIQALAHIPAKYGFLVWDVYRSRETQSNLFMWMRNEIKKNYPLLSDEENFQETKKYMSAPSKIGDSYCPPHLSGGAIDLTLFNLDTKSALEMGTPFDDCSEKAHSDYFNHKLPLTKEDEVIKDRRNLLTRAMESVGFVKYKYEWWHFDIGDIFWSQKTGYPEVFGPLFGDNEWITK